jgi:hypothetical protein
MNADFPQGQGLVELPGQSDGAAQTQFATPPILQQQLIRGATQVTVIPVHGLLQGQMTGAPPAKTIALTPKVVAKAAMRGRIRVNPSGFGSEVLIWLS